MMKPYKVVILVLLIVIANLIAIIVFTENIAKYLSVLSIAISIILSIVAIVFTYIAGIPVMRIDRKIDEMKELIEKVSRVTDTVAKTQNEVTDTLTAIQQHTATGAETIVLPTDLENELIDLSVSLDALQILLDEENKK